MNPPVDMMRITKQDFDSSLKNVYGLQMMTKNDWNVWQILDKDWLT